MVLARSYQEFWDVPQSYRRALKFSHIHAYSVLLSRVYLC